MDQMLQTKTSNTVKFTLAGTEYCAEPRGHGMYVWQAKPGGQGRVFTTMEEYDTWRSIKAQKKLF